MNTPGTCRGGAPWHHEWRSKRAQQRDEHHQVHPCHCPAGDSNVRLAHHLLILICYHGSDLLQLLRVQEQWKSLAED